MTEVRGTAQISDDAVYRYRLTREWGEGRRPMLWVGLNPSTADAVTPDNTITRLIGFAKREGSERIVVVNVYAFRATKPANLPWDELRAIGPENDRTLVAEADRAERIVACWGAGIRSRLRERAVYMMLSGPGRRVEALGATGKGHPRHPLYLRADTPLVAWEPR